MEINKALENALKLADLDLNKIQNVIENDFFGSNDAYFEHVNQLAIDFESAFALLILESSPEQITTFATINLRKVDKSINGIKSGFEVFSKFQTQIDNDDCKGVMDGLIYPVWQCHLEKLVYIRKLLNDTLEGMSSKFISKRGETEKEEEVEVVKNDTETEIDALLSNYGELLSMKDMKAIFKVGRNAIYTYEKEGHFNRCSAPNRTILFRKEEIKRYLTTRK
jgi:hypothetical protein